MFSRTRIPTRALACQRACAWVTPVDRRPGFDTRQRHPYLPPMWLLRISVLALLLGPSSLALAEAGEKFDVVICDPPAFAPARPALEAGLRAYERIARLAAPLVAEGGYLTLCSCSHAADLTRFRNASARGIGRGGRRGQIIHTGFAGPDHPMLPHLAESGYLKALTFRL